MGSAKSVVATKHTGSLEEGKTIFIKARIPSGAARFSVNLTCPDDSVAFHFNPRFDETPKVVVCNTWTPSWLWWKVEQVSRVPFSPGTSFEMTITVRNKYYEVSIDGKHFLNFDHRIPYHTVQNVNFRGRVELEDFSYTSVKAPPPYNPNENKTAMYPSLYNPPEKTTTWQTKS